MTVDAVTRELPQPFTVMATQNPVGSSGTQMLPESQLDRFMVRLSMGYPSHEAAVQILKGQEFVPMDSVERIVTRDKLIGLQDKARTLSVHDSIFDYIVTLVEATRESELFSMGASPRGANALLRMSRAMAVLSGREYVVPGDIAEVFNDVLGHRVKLAARARANGMTVAEALDEVIRFQGLRTENIRDISKGGSADEVRMACIQIHSRVCYKSVDPSFCAFIF